MKKILTIISAIIFTLLTVNSIAKAEIKVVTSIKPIHSLVSYVMDGVGKPDIIVDGYNSPHNFSLKPSHAKMIENANLIIWVGEDLEINVSDNGRGLSNGKEAPHAHRSRGTAIVRERLALLRHRGTLNIEEGMESHPFQRGVTSRLSFPLWALEPAWNQRESKKAS